MPEPPKVLVPQFDAMSVPLPAAWKRYQTSLWMGRSLLPELQPASGGPSVVASVVSYGCVVGSEDRTVGDVAQLLDGVPGLVQL